MKFKCKSTDIGFLERAPIQLRYTIGISSRIEDVYAVLIDPHTWPHWFPSMTGASELEETVDGASRIVTLNYLIDFKEEFIVRETPRRIAYRVAAVSVPYADELVEEFSLNSIATGVEVTYRIGFRVHHSLNRLSWLVERIGAHSYKRALSNLKVYIEGRD